MSLHIGLVAWCYDRIAHFVRFSNFFVFHWFYKHFQLCRECINSVEWCEGGMCGGQQSTNEGTWRLQKGDCRFHTGNIVFFWRQPGGRSEVQGGSRGMWMQVGGEAFSNEIWKCASRRGKTNGFEDGGMEGCRRMLSCADNFFCSRTRPLVRNENHRNRPHAHLGADLQ